MFSLRPEVNNILIFGDFNAHSGELDDYVRVDKCLTDLYGLYDIYNENIDSFESFGLCNLPLTRRYEDKTANAYENICLFILNGRLGLDKTGTKLKCKDKITVDYLLLSAQFFSAITLNSK